MGPGLVIQGLDVLDHDLAVLASECYMLGDLIIPDDESEPGMPSMRDGRVHDLALTVFNAQVQLFLTPVAPPKIIEDEVLASNNMIPGGVAGGGPNQTFVMPGVLAQPVEEDDGSDQENQDLSG